MACFRAAQAGAQDERHRYRGSSGGQPSLASADRELLCVCPCSMIQWQSAFRFVRVSVFCDKRLIRTHMLSGHNVHLHACRHTCTRMLHIGTRIHCACMSQIICTDIRASASVVSLVCVCVCELVGRKSLLKHFVSLTPAATASSLQQNCAR